MDLTTLELEQMVLPIVVVVVVDEMLELDELVVQVYL